MGAIHRALRWMDFCPDTAATTTPGADRHEAHDPVNCLINDGGSYRRHEMPDEYQDFWKSQQQKDNNSD